MNTTLLEATGVLTVVASLGAAILGFIKLRPDIKSTNASASKTSVDASKVVADIATEYQQQAFLAAKYAAEQTALAREANHTMQEVTDAMNSVLARLAAVLRILDEIPDTTRVGSVRDRIAAALRGETPPLTPAEHEAVEIRPIPLPLKETP